MDSVMALSGSELHASDSTRSTVVDCGTPSPKLSYASSPEPSKPPSAVVGWEGDTEKKVSDSSAAKKMRQRRRSSQAVDQFQLDSILASKLTLVEQTQQSVLSSLISVAHALAVSCFTVPFMYGLAQVPFVVNGGCVTTVRENFINIPAVAAVGISAVVLRYHTLAVFQHIILFSWAVVKPHIKLVVIGGLVLCATMVPFAVIFTTGDYAVLSHGSLLVLLVLPMALCRGLFSKKMGKRISADHLRLVKVIALPNNLGTVVNLLFALLLYNQYQKIENDWVKGVVVLVPFPILWDFLGAFWRHAARILGTEDIAFNTRSFAISFCLFRNLWNRLFLLSIGDETVALILTILLGIQEIAMRLSVAKRDAVLWSRVLYRKHPGFPAEVRKCVRAQFEVLDATWEIFGIITSAFIYIFFWPNRVVYDFYSGAGFMEPDTVSVICYRMLLPIVVEMLSDFLVFLISARHQVPVLKVSKGFNLPDFMYSVIVAIESCLWMLAFQTCYLLSMELLCSGSSNPCDCSLPHWAAGIAQRCCPL